MARYVDAEQFEKRLMELFMEPRYMHDEDNYYTAMSIAIDEIRHTPTADVVEVVRCKDCKYLMKDIVTEETPYGFDEDRYVFGCKKFFESSGEWVDVMLDDYCSSGERRCYKPEE